MKQSVQKRLEQLEARTRERGSNIVARWKQAFDSGLFATGQHVDPWIGETLADAEWRRRYPRRALAWDQARETLEIFEDPLEA